MYQLRPHRLLAEDFAEDRQGLFELVAGGQGDGGPEGDLHDVRGEFFRRTVFDCGPGKIAVLDRKVSFVHVLVSPLESDEPPEFLDRLGMVLDAEVE